MQVDIELKRGHIGLVEKVVDVHFGKESLQPGQKNVTPIIRQSCACRF